MLNVRANSKYYQRYINKIRCQLIRGISNEATPSKKSALGSAYKPSEVEKEEYECSYFQPKLTSEKPPFRMILPPPNITGTLHLGHALTATVQDVIIRWKRMQGIETVWIPGIDHAGIATQVVVEKRLWKENRQTRHDIGRKVFQERVWKWKEEKTDAIGQQLRRLGASLNWSRGVFTMDQVQSRAVAEAFIRLYESGLIYRTDHLVNWSCVLQSAISDIEVDHVEVDGSTLLPVPGYDKPIEFGVLTYFSYKLHDSDEEVVVATTRPETMLGDVAVAVNPRDDRYSRYIGRNLWHPFRRQTIPIICDDFVDPNFGTGAVKVTPAHDHVDFEVGKRHALDNLQVIDEKGNLTSVCGEFSGARRFDARDLVLARLKELQLLRDRREHRMIVPICSRSKDVIEFIVRPQWFIKCAEMAAKAAEDVREGRLTIEPKGFEKTWFAWLENIRDWCVSRQLWWGHRIPAYSCHFKDQPDSALWVAAQSPEDARCKAATLLSTTGDNITVLQDEDVLDTWFSSALLPFSAFGWPQQTRDLGAFYPLDMMETGHDILFFWVARMVMLGSQLTGRLPFNKILLHGIICDAQGRKMSKSLGNVIAPEDVISGASLKKLETDSTASYDAGILSSEELACAIKGQKKMFPEGIPECGTDALRFTLCSHNIKSHFINFDVQECHTNKLFCNKIWQATKFTNIWMEKISQRQALTHVADVTKLALMDRWILSRLTHLVDVSEKSLHNYDFHLVTAALKTFLYYEFCDVYLETTKRGLKCPDARIATGHCWTLTKSLDSALQVLALFMPRLSQHLHLRLAEYPGEIKNVNFPKNFTWRDEPLEKQVQEILDIIVGIRRLKKYFGVTAKHKAEVYVVGDESVLGNFSGVIEDLSASHKVNITSQVDKALIKNTVSDRIGRNSVIYLAVPSELRRAVELDLPKLDSKKMKLIKELEKMNKMISGDNYKVKATQEAQEIHAKKVAVLQEQLKRLDYLQTFSEQSL